MARINYKGKDLNHISIGPSKAFDKQDWVSGLDYFRTHPAGTPSTDNPYLITVAPGLPEAQVTAGDTDGLSHLHILGESRVASILKYSGTGNANPALMLGDSTNPYTNLTIENIRVVRLGDATSVAVQLGADAGDAVGSNNTDSTRRWIDTRFVNCTFEGGEGIRIFGITTASSDNSPILEISNCMFYGMRYGGHIQGNITLNSQGTSWVAEAVPTWPWSMTDVAHERQALTVCMTESSYDSRTAYRFKGDRVVALGRDLVGGGATLRSLAGLCLIVATAGAAPNIWMHGCRLRAVYGDTDGTITSPRFGAVFCRAGAFSLDQVICQSCNFEVVQESGGNYTGVMAGVVDNINGAVIRVSGHVLAVDAGSASEYSLASQVAGANIYHMVTSATAKNTGSAGTYTAETLVA